jgi:D-alanine transaminase
MGTTTGVMPIVQVDDWLVGDGTPGPVTQELLRAFRALTPS